MRVKRVGEVYFINLCMGNIQQKTGSLACYAKPPSGPVLSTCEHLGRLAVVLNFLSICSFCRLLRRPLRLHL